jgi:hypothetical protein
VSLARASVLGVDFTCWLHKGGKAIGVKVPGDARLHTHNMSLPVGMQRGWREIHTRDEIPEGLHPYLRAARNRSMRCAPDWTWTGPRPTDLQADGATLLAPVEPDRWPYGPPSHHQSGCTLHAGGVFCDCDASANDDSDWGVAH